MPLAATLGWTENKSLLVLVSWKSTDWLDSLGPAEMLVAQPSIVCAPASSFTLWSAPLVKPGASFTASTVTLTVFWSLFLAAAQGGFAELHLSGSPRSAS